MQVNIAICDDETYICSQLENMIFDILKEKNIKCEIEVFFSGESLCQELARHKYDVIFLDIELPKVNGIYVGNYIRDTLNNEVVQIAYISAQQKYAMELFDIRPINFLVKPLNKEKIQKVINKYLKIVEQDNHTFEYKKKTDYYKVMLSQIIYFENVGRKVKICTMQGNDEFYDSLENVYQKVKQQKFLFIHKSIIINYEFIKKISHDEVIMINGEILPISQLRRKSIKELYMKLREEELES